MLGNLGLHIIKNPAGTFSYVGRLPVVLADIVPATRADVMGQRAFKDADGELKAYKFPVFRTAAEAIQHAERCGITITNETSTPDASATG